MSTIDQKGPSSKPANDTSGEEGRTKRSAEETARIQAETESSGANAEVDKAMDRMEDALQRPVESTSAPVEEEATESVALGLTALASLRAYVEEHGTSSDIESALSKLEEVIRRLPQGHPEEAEEPLPASGRRRTDSGDDEEPVTSRSLPPPLSRFAIRDDGALLVSLEDAADRDTTGRDVIAFMVLSAEESSRARESLDGALSDAAAKTIGRLPKRTP